MRHLRWLLILIAAIPWAFLALGETPKKAKSNAKQPAKTADLMSLSETDRRAILLDKVEGDRRKRSDEQRKEARSTALKSAARLETQLKSAAEDDKPAILYELGVTHWRVENAPQALKWFRQIAKPQRDPKSEIPNPNSEIWSARARIHLFDILLYENHDLAAARAVIDGDAPASDRDAHGADPIIRLAPRKTADKPLAPESVAANLAVRRALVELLDGQPVAPPANAPGAPIWNILARWNPEYANVFNEASDAVGLTRLMELHFAAADHAAVLPLATAIVAMKALHPTKSQKSLAYFRRAKSACQLNAARQPSERSLKDATSDYALSVKADNEAAWCSDALFLAANIHWNQFHDDAQAIRLWKDLLARYPNAPLAEKASYNIGALHQQYGEQEKAKAAFADFRKRFPDSKLVTALNEEGLAAHIKAIKRP